MADRSITVPEPAEASTGLRIIFRRKASGVEIHVYYESPGGSCYDTTLQLSDFTPAQRTQLQAVRSFIMDLAKPRMGF